MGLKSVEPDAPLMIFGSGETARFSATRGCRVSKTIAKENEAYLVVVRERKSGGTDFDMLVSLKPGDKSDGRPMEMEILVTERDFRNPNSVSWIEDVRLEDGKPLVLLASYSKLKQPSKVQRSWVKLQAIFEAQ